MTREERIKELEDRLKQIDHRIDEIEQQINRMNLYVVSLMGQARKREGRG